MYAYTKQDLSRLAMEAAPIVSDEERKRLERLDRTAIAQDCTQLFGFACNKLSIAPWQ